MEHDEFNEGSGPELFEHELVFLAAEAGGLGFFSGGFGADAEGEERAGDVGDGSLLAVDFEEGDPVEIETEAGGEDGLGEFLEVVGCGGALDGVAEGEGGEADWAEAA